MEFHHQKMRDGREKNVRGGGQELKASTGLHTRPRKILDKVVGREGTSTEANVSGESGDPVNEVGANIY